MKITILFGRRCFSLPVTAHVLSEDDFSLGKDKLINKRYFDTVFQRPYRYFSIALKVSFSLSDRYKTFISNWLGI